MKRTRSHYKPTVPAKRIKPNGRWEDSVTTPRIMDLFEKLRLCLLRRNGQAFLDCLEEEECTQEEFVEVAQLRDEPDLYCLPTLLHASCWNATTDLGHSLEVLRKLIEADRNAILSRNNHGNLPLHQTLHWNAPEEFIALLVNADPSSLLVQNNHGSLPLHSAIFWNWRFSNIAVIQVLYKSDRKKEILDTKNDCGRTPIHLACYLDRPAFPLLAEERIQLVEGVPEWQEQLRELVKKYQELKEMIREARLEYSYMNSFADSFMKIFNDTISTFDYLLERQVMTLVELAVWKGHGLTDNPNERKARRITCGAHHVARQVAGFLGIDSIGLLQAEYDRIVREANDPLDSSDESSDDSDDD